MTTKTEQERQDRDAYAEQAFEMKAEGMKPPSFKRWKLQNEYLQAYVFAKIKEQK